MLERRGKKINNREHIGHLTYLAAVLVVRSGQHYFDCSLPSLSLCPAPFLCLAHLPWTASCWSVRSEGDFWGRGQERVKETWVPGLLVTLAGIRSRCLWTLQEGTHMRQEQDEESYHLTAQSSTTTI